MSLRTWIRRAVERQLDRFYEGPEAPRRLADMVSYFASTNPRATRAQWVAFAGALAGEAYRSGYLQGYEHLERGVPPWKTLSPDDAADAMTPGWREWSAPVDLEEPDYVPPEEADDAATVAAQLMRNFAKR